MLALGSGAQESMKKQIAALGSNRLMVQPQPQHTAGVKQQSGAVSRLTVDEAMNIDGRIPTVAGVTGMVSGRVQMVYGDKNANTQLQGTMPGYEVVYNAYPRLRTLLYAPGMCRARAGRRAWHHGGGRTLRHGQPGGRDGTDQPCAVSRHRRSKRPRARAAAAMRTILCSCRFRLR